MKTTIEKPSEDVTKEKITYPCLYCEGGVYYALATGPDTGVLIAVHGNATDWKVGHAFESDGIAWERHADWVRCKTPVTITFEN